MKGRERLMEIEEGQRGRRKMGGPRTREGEIAP